MNKPIKLPYGATQKLLGPEPAVPVIAFVNKITGCVILRVEGNNYAYYLNSPEWEIRNIELGDCA